VHQQDWDNAQRVAEKHAPAVLPDVYVGQARVAFEAGDYAKAESFLLRAHKPEIIVKSYKELGVCVRACAHTHL
jgi:intraflagellar transport protein 172